MKGFAMSRVTPPPASTPSPSDPSRDPNRRPGVGGSGGKGGIPGSAGNRPNTTTPLAPSLGASAPPPAGNGQPANKLPAKQGNGAASAPAPSSEPQLAPVGGMPPIDQLQGRPIGRVLTKMGKVNREQVVEALDFQKSKGGAIGRILIDLGYIKETDLNIALAAQKGYELFNLEGVTVAPEAIAAVPAQIATTNKVLPIAFDSATK